MRQQQDSGESSDQDSGPTPGERETEVDGSSHSHGPQCCLRKSVPARQGAPCWGSQLQYSCMGQSWGRAWPRVECWVDLDCIASGSCPLTTFLLDVSILKGEWSSTPGGHHSDLWVPIALRAISPCSPSSCLLCHTPLSPCLTPSPSHCAPCPGSSDKASFSQCCSQNADLLLFPWWILLAVEV